MALFSVRPHVEDDHRTRPGDRVSRTLTLIATMKIYQLALTAGLRSPFAPVDELHPDSAKSEDIKENAKDDRKNRRFEIDAKKEGKKDDGKPGKAEEEKKFHRW